MKRRFQFSLRSLFFMTAFVALAMAVLALIVSSPPRRTTPWFTIEPPTQVGGWTGMKGTLAVDDHQGSLRADAEQNVLLFVSQAHQPSGMKPSIQYGGDQVAIFVPSDPPVGPLVLEDETDVLIVWILPDEPRRYRLGPTNAKSIYQRLVEGSPRTRIVKGLVSLYDGPQEQELRALLSDSPGTSPLSRVKPER